MLDLVPLAGARREVTHTTIRRPVSSARTDTPARSRDQQSGSGVFSKRPAVGISVGRVQVAALPAPRASSMSTRRGVLSRGGEGAGGEIPRRWTRTRSPPRRPMLRPTSARHARGPKAPRVTRGVARRLRGRDPRTAFAVRFAASPPRAPSARRERVLTWARRGVRRAINASEGDGGGMLRQRTRMRSPAASPDVALASPRRARGPIGHRAGARWKGTESTAGLAAQSRAAGRNHGSPRPRGERLRRQERVGRGRGAACHRANRGGRRSESSSAALV